MYDSHWWVAYVLQTCEDTDEVKVNFLHPHGPSPSFVSPAKPDTCVIRKCDIITRVDPVTPTARTYNLPASDLANINNLVGEL